MEDLKILKSKSEQAVIQFGGLYHKFLWRVSKSYHYLIPPELIVLSRYEDWSFLNYNLTFLAAATTGSGRSSENKKDSQDVPDAPKPVCLRQWPGDLYSHNDSSFYLIKPAQANWDSDSALRTLDSLAKKIIPYTSQIEIGPNKDPLCKFLNDNNFRQVSSYDRKLLLILHILMKSEPFPIAPKSGVSKFAEAQKNEPYIRTIDDVFSSFAFVCELLLEDVENDLAGKRLAGSEQNAKPDRDEKTTGNISGMTWEEAKKKAEALVDEKGYLGFQKLAKAVGCSEGTLRKVIKEKSSKLRQAKEQFESTSKTLKAVGFTAKVVATYEDSSGSQLSDTETHGILTEMLNRIKRERPEMFEQTKEQLDEMNPDGKRKFAAIYQSDYQNKDKSLSKDCPKTLRQYKQV